MNKTAAVCFNVTIAPAMFFVLTIQECQKMKKNLLLTTAIVAAALCFADTAKADDPVAGSEINAAATVTQGVSGFTRDETNSDAGAKYWGVYGLSGAADLTINAGLTFDGNKNTVSGGAIFNALTDNRVDGQNVTVTIGDNVTFSGNESKRGGAFYSEGAEIAGAHNFDYGTEMTAGDNVTFTGNKANQYGGAIALNGMNTATFGDDVTFSGNTVTTNAGEYYGGGAIWAYTYYNTFAAGDYAGDITVDFGKRATFTGNTSQREGGAIELLIENWDETGTQPVYPNPVNTMRFDDGAVFKNNTAVTGRGGAIANFGGELNFGKVTFSGNKANGVLNDIHNEGTVNFNGDVTLDGGITGDGTVVFAAGTTLTAKLQTTEIEAGTVTFAGDNTLKLTVANGLADEDYDFINAGTLNGTENVTVADNAIYNLALTDEGKINVTVKSAQEIIESSDVPVTAQEAGTLSALISSNGNGTDTGNAIADAIAEAMQTGNAAAAVQGAKDLAPTTSQQVMGVAQGVNNMLSGVTGGRMAAVSGRAGGDAFSGGSVWAQTLYNHTEQSSTSDNAGFQANSAGVVVGIDGKANDALTVGFGYGFTRTDAKPSGRKVDIDGHNFFVYGSYQPDQWYVDTMISYGIGQYTEKKAPMGIAMSAKYHVNTFAANIVTGYGFHNGITPEGGLRYVAAMQESYNDGAQNVSADNNDVLTAVMGMKYNGDMNAGDWKIKPNFRLAATYDLISDNSKANISIIGGGNYEIVGKRLRRLGAEAGAGITATAGKWELSLEYNGGFRRDYQSHTGIIKAQYNF